MKLRMVKFISLLGDEYFEVEKKCLFGWTSAIRPAPGGLTTARFHTKEEAESFAINFMTAKKSYPEIVKYFES